MIKKGAIGLATLGLLAIGLLAIPFIINGGITGGAVTELAASPLPTPTPTSSPIPCTPGADCETNADCGGIFGENNNVCLSSKICFCESADPCADEIGEPSIVCDNDGDCEGIEPGTPGFVIRCIEGLLEARPNIGCCVPKLAATPTPTSTSTTVCEEELEGAIVVVQAPYVDDTTHCPLYLNRPGGTPPPNAADLCNDLKKETDGSLTIKASFPIIANKDIGFVGLEEDNRVIKVKLTFEEELTGIFIIDVNGKEEYLSNEITIPACEETTIELNPLDSLGAVTAIPFVPGSHLLVRGSSQVTWQKFSDTLKFFRFTEKTQDAIITLNFGTIIGTQIEKKKISETKIEKVIETVRMDVAWIPFVLDGNIGVSDAPTIAAAKQRALNEPSMFIKASYPVENTKYKPQAGKFAIPFSPQSDTTTTLVEWRTQLSDEQRDEARWELVAQIDQVLRFAIYDRIFLIAQDNLLDYLGAVGIASSDTQISIIEREQADTATEAHEGFHNKIFRGKDDYIRGGRRGFDAIGYEATMLNEGGDSGPPNGNYDPARPFIAGAPSVGFMGRLNVRQSVVRKDHWKEMIPFFDEDQIGVIDPPIWHLRAVLEANGATVENLEVLPIYHFDSILEQRTPCNGEPNCIELTIKTTLNNGTILEETIPVRTTVFIDNSESETIGKTTPIGAIFDYTPDIQRITILDEDENTLFDKTVSSSFPTLRIISPPEGARRSFNTSASIPIIISAADQDGDTMHASVYIEEQDRKADPLVLDREVEGQVEMFTLETKDLSVGEHKIKVLLTDGFNTMQKEVNFIIRAR